MTSSGGLISAVATGDVGVEIVEFKGQVNEYGTARIEILKYSDLLSDFVLQLPNLHPSLIQLCKNSPKGYEQLIQSITFAIGQTEIFKISGTQLIMETNIPNLKGFIKLAIPKINMLRP